MKITAIIVVNGNPKYLNESLSSIVSEVDELIIGNVGMTAKIPETVQKNAKIIKVSKTIPFADLIKEDLKKQASGDYILYLDPDEIMPKELWRELKNNISDYDCFFIPRKNIIFNKWIKHSRWWPDYQLRFFKKDTVVWPKTLHPTPQVKGKEYKIPDKEELAILHYNYENISHFMEKSLRYAKYESEELSKKNEQYSLSIASKKGINEFISRYFAYDGYKDGTHGFVLAFLQMFYYFLVYFFYWEKNKYISPLGEEKPDLIGRYFAQGLYESNHWMKVKKLSTLKNKIRMSIQNRILKPSLFQDSKYHGFQAVDETITDSRHKRAQSGSKIPWV